MATQTPDTLNYLFYGYTFVWILLSLYIISISKRIKKLEKQLKED